ncbi:MAG: hypothetical protein ACT4OP_02095 [Actinomycetota bacterium]
MIRCPRPDLSEALSRVIADPSLVFVTDPATVDDWNKVRAELLEAFAATRTAIAAGGSVAYVVDSDDLLGRNGTGRATVACALLSAARTAALEQVKSGIPVNVVAIESTSDSPAVAEWVARLSSPGGPQGELVRLGSGHLGKALP